MLKKLFLTTLFLSLASMAQAQDPIVGFEGDLKLSMKELKKTRTYQVLGSDGLIRHGFKVSTSAGDLNLKFSDMSIPRTLIVEFYSKGFAEEEGAGNGCFEQAMSAINAGQDLNIQVLGLDRAKLEQMVKPKIVLKKNNEGELKAHRRVKVLLDVNSDIDFSCSAE